MQVPWVWKTYWTYHLYCLLSLLAEFATYLNYCRALRFDDKPDYSFLRQIFRALFHRQGYTYDYIFDWNLLKTVSIIRTAESDLHVDFASQPKNRQKLRQKSVSCSLRFFAPNFEDLALEKICACISSRVGWQYWRVCSRLKTVLLFILFDSSMNILETEKRSHLILHLQNFEILLWSLPKRLSRSRPFGTAIRVPFGVKLELLQFA